MRRWAGALVAGLAGLLAALDGRGESVEAFEYADDRIPKGAAKWHTPVDIARGGDGSIFVAARDSGKILRLDAKLAKPEEWASVDRLLHNVAVDAAAGRLYASVGHADGEVIAFDLKTARPLWRTRVGHTPRAIVPRGNTIYVACQHENDVALLDGTGAIKSRFPVEREPVDLALTPDGGRLVVVNQLPAMAANQPGVAAGVNVIDLRMGTNSVVKLAPGSHSAQSVALSPDGRFAYVPSIVSSYHLPTSQIERGWIQTAGLNVIDLATGKLARWFLLDDVDRGAANPWDCVVLEKERQLVISLSGTHELMFIDLEGLGERMKDSIEGRQLGELEAIRRRVPLAEDKSPRALVAAGAGVWYGATFSDSLGYVKSDGDRPLRRYDFATGERPDAVRQGEIDFHDATLSVQHWLSCSSCHPGNARVDALNWDLLNDGIGTFKNTKSLVGAHATPPTTWTGVRANANVSVRSGITHILFREVNEDTARALDAYLSSLRYLPSPHRGKGDAALVAEGERLFTERGCTHCHSGPHLTNLKAYDLGTGRGVEAGKKFDVPTLREIWRTGPYLHDGRAVTIEEAIAELNQDEHFHEKTNLQEKDIAAIAAYLRTL